MTTELTDLAEHAAADLHALAALARPAITALDISELRTITGALADLAAGLPQILNQLARYLQTDADSPGHYADHPRQGLRDAATPAALLAFTLDAAHQTLGDLAETTTGTKHGGSIFNRR
jgi:hypothetical protein